MQILTNVRGSVTIVYLNGDVYPEDMQDFTRQMTETIDAIDPRRVVLNMSKVQFLPSLALGQLVGFQKKVKGAGGVVKICGLTPNIEKVFKLTRFDKLFDIFAREDEAVQSFGTL